MSDVTSESPGLPATAEEVSAALAAAVSAGPGWRPDRTWAELGFLIGELDARGLAWSIGGPTSAESTICQACVNRRVPGATEPAWTVFESEYDHNPRLALCRAALAALIKEAQK